MTKRNGGEGDRYDLEERTALFGEAVIAFAKKIPVSEVTRSLIDQVVRAGTCIGANYCEANDGESKKRFPSQDRHLPKGIKGDSTLGSDDRCRGAIAARPRTSAMEGSDGTEPHLRSNPSQPR
jgi:hypothetical protein